MPDSIRSADGIERCPHGREKSHRALAIFDLDGTLTLRDTFLPFLVSYGWRYQRILATATLPVPVGLYAMRLMADRDAKEQLLCSFFRGEPADRIAEHADWFCRSWLPARLNASVVQALRRHQADGDRVIVLSASPSLYVPRVAQALGVNEVVCTEVAIEGECCTGRLAGPNCKGNAKLDLLHRYLGRTTAPTGSSSYGDSLHDLPVLNWVENGWWVRGRQLIRVHTSGMPATARHRS